MKIILDLFNSLHEMFCCTDYNTKKPQLSARSHVGKNQEKPQKLPNFQKKTFFTVFQIFFAKLDFAETWGFCVVMSASKRFIGAINSPLG